jgi:DNA-binding NtrC family response regulator
MPGDMNGIELALELERLHPELPVILNTGYAEQIEEATSRGMRVFQKPVSPEVLLNELRTLLDSKKNNSAL